MKHRSIPFLVSVINSIFYHIAGIHMHDHNQLKSSHHIISEVDYCLGEISIPCEASTTKFLSVSSSVFMVSL